MEEKITFYRGTKSLPKDNLDNYRYLQQQQNKILTDMLFKQFFVYFKNKCLVNFVENNKNHLSRLTT